MLYVLNLLFSWLFILLAGFELVIILHSILCNVAITLDWKYAVFKWSVKHYLNVCQGILILGVSLRYLAPTAIIFPSQKA